MNTQCRSLQLALWCVAMAWAQGLLAADPEFRGREGGRWRRGLPNGKNESAVRGAFEQPLQAASAATVRILAEGEEVALGAVVQADGYVVTKASVLRGKITCRFKGGTDREARIVGQNSTHDLALLHVDAADLPTISWREGAPPPGSLVATTAPASRPVAIGVVGTEIRRIRGPAESPPPRGWLGVGLGDGQAGAVVVSVEPNSPAAKAGVHVGDEIQQINGTAMGSVEQVIRTVGSQDSGKKINVRVRRQEESLELSAELARPQPRQAPQDEWGGGPFSHRRSGFPAVLAHDTPLHPRDCGGPLVDTDGRAVGINIARALRVATYALPASVVQEAVRELKQQSGK